MEQPWRKGRNVLALIFGGEVDEYNETAELG
jgi:hypothetical protein